MQKGTKRFLERQIKSLILMNKSKKRMLLYLIKHLSDNKLYSMAAVSFMESIEARAFSNWKNQLIHIQSMGNKFDCGIIINKSIQEISTQVEL